MDRAQVIGEFEREILVDGDPGHYGEILRLARLGLWAEQNHEVLKKALIECRDYRAAFAAISFPGES